MPHERSRVVIVGGGIIGLSVARELSAQNYAVTVLERGPIVGREASHAAAGMLAPRLEFDEGEALLSPALESLNLYSRFVADLEKETDRDVDLRLNGIIAPLRDAEARRAPRPGARRLSKEEIQELAPGLSPSLSCVDYYAGEGSVDNRALVRAILLSCRQRAVQVRENVMVREVVTEGGRVVGVRTEADTVTADIVVNCAGAWSSRLQVDSEQLNVRPIKGQMLLLQADPSSPCLPQHVLYEHKAYVVPRSDGRVIIGTTVEDVGFDKRVEAWAVNELLKNALTLCPELASAPLVEQWAGLRPKDESELPVVGARGPTGYYVATGHFRNGILLAPLTARRLSETIVKQPKRSPVA